MADHEYRINVYTDILRKDAANTYQEIAKLGANKKWMELIDILQGNEGMVNSSQLPDRNGQQTSLFTPLHYAADGKAPKEIFEKLLKLGSSKCLKTSAGETAYDIGKRKGLDQDILELIKVPKHVKQNEQQIQAMEAGLHNVIKGRVEDLIKKNGQALPQISILFENNDDHGSFYYPVPGMYGGFNVHVVDKGIQADSWIRVCGGSEENHLIEKDGKVTLLPNDNPL